MPPVPAIRDPACGFATVLNGCESSFKTSVVRTATWLCLVKYFACCFACGLLDGTLSPLRYSCAMDCSGTCLSVICDVPPELHIGNGNSCTHDGYPTGDTNIVGSVP